MPQMPVAAAFLADHDGIGPPFAGGPHEPSHWVDSLADLCIDGNPCGPERSGPRSGQLFPQAVPLARRMIRRDPFDERLEDGRRHHLRTGAGEELGQPPGRGTGAIRLVDAEHQSAQGASGTGDRDQRYRAVGGGHKAVSETVGSS